MEPSTTTAPSAAAVHLPARSLGPWCPLPPPTPTAVAAGGIAPHPHAHALLAGLCPSCTPPTSGSLPSDEAGLVLGRPSGLAAGERWAVLLSPSAHAEAAGWAEVAPVLRASARRLPPAAPTPSASRPYRGEVELVLELLVADGREEGVVREVRLPVVPREVTDAPTVAASGEEEEEEELQKEAAAAPSGRHRRWWGCCQAATHTIALHAPPAHADEDQEEEEAVGLVLLLAFADDRAASHFMDYVFYLQTVAPPVPANEDGEPGDEEEEEEEEEAAEREDYDEKYTFTQTEYWECFHEETGQECFEWYSAEELQRHSILRVLGRFFVPALAAAAAAAATPVYRVLDVGAGTSELPFNLYEALSTESKRIGRPFRVELWSVDFARTAVEFLRGQKWIRGLCTDAGRRGGRLALRGSVSAMDATNRLPQEPGRTAPRPGRDHRRPPAPPPRSRFKPRFYRF